MKFKPTDLLHSLFLLFLKSILLTHITVESAQGKFITATLNESVKPYIIWMPSYLQINLGGYKISKLKNIHNF